MRRTRRRHDRRRCLRRWYGELLGGDGASVVVGLVARVGASLRCGVGLGRVGVGSGVVGLEIGIQSMAQPRKSRLFFKQ